MGIGLILLIIIAVVVVWIIAVYNGLIRLKNRVDEAWSDIDVQLKRRYDLIPNLVNIVKGYAAHERELFEKVTEARTRAMGAGTMADKSQAENMLTQTLKSLQASRRVYNGTVRDFNTKIQVFPNNIIAGMLKLTAREFFEAEGEEKEPVKVEF
ncbi:MAG: LemA family protein [Candidatus Moranbacteria bacterium]|nr:LemA family protein [Candidatus Moranbacteria bacterium]